MSAYMSKRETYFYSLSFWKLVVGLTALNLIVFGTILLNSATALIVQYVPDDSYYYLTLSRNFSSSNVWTFDSGVSVTSGFHPLFAYLLVSIFSLLHPELHSFVVYSMILSLLFSLGSVLILWLWGYRQRKVLFLMFLALLISTRNFVYNAISITEWALTVFIASLYCVWFFTKYDDTEIKSTDLGILFVLGFLGSAARSDFGLLPLSIFVASLILFSETTRRQKAFSFVGLLGSTIGLFTTLIHNYLLTGEFLQSSAKMKAYWSELIPPNYLVVPVLIGMILGIAGVLLIVLLIGGVTFQNIKWKSDTQSNNKKSVQDFSGKNSTWENQNSSSPIKYSNHKFLVVSSSVCIVGYALFYSRNAAIQPWYSANLILPVFMLIFAFSSKFEALGRNMVKKFFAFLFLMGIIFNISNLYPISTGKAPWPHQERLFNAGTYLEESDLDCRIGAWNAGSIGYYEGGHIVNLDGLVNNDIYPYAVNNNLPAYLAKTDICYIVDFDRMLTEPSFRIRGGYDDDRFIARLEPVIIFDEGSYEQMNLILYHISDEDKAD